MRIDKLIFLLFIIIFKRCHFYNSRDLSNLFTEHTINHENKWRVSSYLVKIITILPPSTDENRNSPSEPVLNQKVLHTCRQSNRFRMAFLVL